MDILKWKLTSQNTIISGYNCQRAECLFRGRSYIAWFCSDIPLNAGPYKFSGLPGLIIKVEDKTGNRPKKLDLKTKEIREMTDEEKSKSYLYNPIELN